MPWYDGYWWQWVFQNIAPAPVCAALALAAAWLARKPLRRAWTWLHAGLLADAAAARRIAADTHRALTGQEHPDAPQKGA